MATFLLLALWNANNLSQHTDKLKTFISIHNIVMVISDIHFTDKSNLKLPNYTTYQMDDPAGTAGGGTAIIIKISIKHHQLNSFSQDFLQATSVSGRLSWSHNHFSCSSSTKAEGKATIQRFL
jgi:hypothetical protein